MDATVSRPGVLAPIARLAWPTTLVMFAQIAASTFDAWMAGQLGTAALGGFALVFPFVILMQTLAAGGIGGGIASAVARASGRGSRRDAHDLAVHALIIAAVLGLLFTAVMLIFGRPIFRAFAGVRTVDDTPAIAAALRYAHGFFGGAVATWLMFALASIFRGIGDAAFPGRWMLASSLVQMPLGYLLTFGVGDVPGLGILGIGLEAPLAQIIALTMMGRRIRRDAGGLGLLPFAVPIRLAMFHDILRVGLLASMNPFFSAATTMMVTAFVAPFGVPALAGYGLGSRLEFFLTPLTFGIGSALTVLVGHAVGRGDYHYAKSVALHGAAASFVLCGLVGLFAFLTPGTWAGLFTTDPAVRDSTVRYLVHLGPSYAFFGLGLALAFALQGAARLTVPVLVSAMRPTGIILAVTAGFATTLDALYLTAATMITLYGVLMLAGFLLQPLAARPRRP